MQTSGEDAVLLIDLEGNFYRLPHAALATRVLPGAEVSDLMAKMGRALASLQNLPPDILTIWQKAEFQEPEVEGQGILDNRTKAVMLATLVAALSGCGYSFFMDRQGNFRMTPPQPPASATPRSQVDPPSSGGESNEDTSSRILR